MERRKWDLEEEEVEEKEDGEHHEKAYKKRRTEDLGEVGVVDDKSNRLNDNQTSSKFDSNLLSKAQKVSNERGWTIWNAGKQGRKFYRSLKPENRRKIVGFCDVDVKKLTSGFYTYEESEERPKPKIPIVHFSQAKPPIVICVKQNLTKGQFEENLASLRLVEGRDYFFFS